jgi:hypothetical protein
VCFVACLLAWLLAWMGPCDHDHLIKEGGIDDNDDEDTIALAHTQPDQLQCHAHPQCIYVGVAACSGRRARKNLDRSDLILPRGVYRRYHMAGGTVVCS